MKILFIQNTVGDPSLALTKYLIETCKAMNSLSSVSQITLISATPKLEVDDVVTHSAHGSPYSIKGNILFMLSAIYITLRLKNRFDIVHALYPSTSLVPAFIYKIFFGAKLVYEIRSPWVEMGLNKKYARNSKTMTRLFAYGIECLCKLMADGYIYISPGLRNYYTETFFPKDKPTKIFPSATNFINNASELKRNNFERMVHLGSLESTRKIDILITHFASLLNNYPTLHLDFIGDGDDEEHLIKIVKVKKLEDSVTFHGRLTPDQVKDRLANYDIGITHLPPRRLFQYSSPLKNYEYLSFGLSLLLSKVDPHVEFENAGFAAIYEYNDSQEFINAYKKLMNIEPNPLKINHFLTEHTYDANARKILELYQMLY